MKRILIIDDDPTSLKLTESRLSANGYEIHVSSEAPEGLEKAMKFKPDLIILDVMMPVVNGYNFCRLIKSQETCRHIPIILLTSRGTEEDRKIGQRSGGWTSTAPLFQKGPRRLGASPALQRSRESVAGA